MKTILKSLLVFVAVLVVLFVIVGLMLPTTYEVKRDVVIQAPVQVVHVLVNDLQKWPEWEPWREADPTIKITVGDIAQGVGASQSWTGDSGSGELTFTHSDAGSGIAYDMIFDDLYESKGKVTYHTEADGSSHVEWAMTGDTGTPVIGGYFAMMMDSMVGPMFENGLKKLKAAAEAEATASPEGGDAPEADAG